MSKELFDEANSRPYKVEFFVKDDTYVFYNHDLQVFGRGKKIEEALQNLHKEKEELIQEFIDSDRYEALPHPTKSLSNQTKGSAEALDFRGHLSLFACKLLIILFLFGTAGYMGVKATKQIADRTAGMFESRISRFESRLVGIRDKLKSKIPRHPLKAFEKGLHKAAENSVDPEQTERIRESLRKVVAEVRPFVEELKPLFDEKTN